MNKFNTFNVKTTLNSVPVKATADLHIGEAVYKVNYEWRGGLKITHVSSKDGEANITTLLTAIATNSTDIYNLMVKADCTETNIAKYIKYIARASEEVKTALTK